MKLYLSSYLIPDPKVFTDFVGKELSLIKIGLVTNAKDHKPTVERADKIKFLLEYFKGFGFKVEEINLLDHVEGNNLLERFKKFDVVWFVGGNTYSLRYAIKQSNCESILKQALNEGIIYAGDSAGAIIVGPTLKYFDAADDPHIVPEVIYDGLNIVDFAVLPHWDSPAFSHVLGDIETQLNNDGYKTIRLNDNEYLLVEDGKITNEADFTGLSSRGPSLRLPADK